MLIAGDPEPWGPTISGGRRHRLWRQLLAWLGTLTLVVASAVGTTVFLLYQRVDANLDRVALGELATPVAGSNARHFLLVGSDARGDMTDEQRRELRLGDFDGQRSDTMIYVTISADRSQVTLISLPRDLVVQHEDGRVTKLTEEFMGGPDAVVEALARSYGLPVHHYVAVSIGGFLDVVETLGGVTIELEEPLVDPKSGANFTEPGTYRMTPAEALSYVRSRARDARGGHGDYVRIDRQQTFLRAVLSELVQTGNLANPVRLFRLIDDLTNAVTTDEHLGLDEMRLLAEELRGIIASGVPMATLPSYSQDLPASPGVRRGNYVLPYRPGVAAIQRAVAAGDPLPERATRAEAADVVVGVWSGGRSAAGAVVVPTLAYAGYQAGGAGRGPTELDAGAQTVVYALDGYADEAAKVAALLGTEVRPLPVGATGVPDAAQVMVAVGDDASPNGAGG